MKSRIVIQGVPMKSRIIIQGVPMKSRIIIQGFPMKSRIVIQNVPMKSRIIIQGVPMKSRIIIQNVPMKSRIVDISRILKAQKGRTYLILVSKFNFKISFFKKSLICFLRHTVYLGHLDETLKKLKRKNERGYRLKANHFSS